jgi:hypothetical protein
MDATFTLLALDVPPDYTRRLIEAGFDVDTLSLELKLRAYYGSVWREETFRSETDLDDTAVPVDFSVIDSHTISIPDDTDRLDCDVLISATKGSEVVVLGDGFAHFLPPFLTPRTLVELACIDLSEEEDIDESEEFDFIDIRTDYVYLTWSIVSPLPVQADVRSGGAPFPEVIYFDRTPETSEFPDCWDYKPASPDTLVVDSVEWQAPTQRFINWRDWNISENDLVTSGDFSGVFHKPRGRGGRPQCRAMEDIDSVILHETAGWQMDRVRFVPQRWQSSNTLGTQFKILSDGTIVQMYDVVQQTSHIAAGGFNARSVGIEIVNIVILSGLRGQSVNQVASRFDRWESRDQVFVYEPTARVIRDRSPRPLVRLTRRHWGIFPTFAQLEAAYVLVTFLQRLGVGNASMMGLPGLPFPADLSAVGDEDRFLVETWESELSGMSGVISHSVLQANRIDGDVPALFCWLRSSSVIAGSGAENAYEALIDLYDIGLVNYRCSDGARRYCADTAGFALPRHVRELA